MSGIWLPCYSVWKRPRLRLALVPHRAAVCKTRQASGAAGAGALSGHDPLGTDLCSKNRTSHRFRPSTQDTVTRLSPKPFLSSGPRVLVPLPSSPGWRKTWSMRKLASSDWRVASGKKTRGLRKSRPPVIIWGLKMRSKSLSKTKACWEGKKRKDDYKNQNIYKDYNCTAHFCGEQSPQTAGHTCSPAPESLDLHLRGSSGKVHRRLPFFSSNSSAASVKRAACFTEEWRFRLLHSHSPPQTHTHLGSRLWNVGYHP